MSESLCLRVARLTLALAALSATGCASIAGEAVTVRIESKPDGARAYLIPLPTWNTEGRLILEDPTRLEDYRVGGDAFTPIDATVSNLEQMLVVRRKNRTQTRRVSPDSGDVYSFLFH